MFNHLVEKVRSYDLEIEKSFREARDYEGLELYVMEHLLGVGKSAVKSKPTEKLGR
jgi:xylose isomerase